MTRTLILVSMMNGLVAYLLGHIGSHVAAGVAPRLTPHADLVSRTGLGRAAEETGTPAPLFAVLWFYHWFWFLPWLFAVWFGYKTVWWWAIAALVIGFVFRLILTGIERSFGLTQNAWVISLGAIPAIPILFWLMVSVTLGRV